MRNLKNIIIVITLISVVLILFFFIKKNNISSSVELSGSLLEAQREQQIQEQNIKGHKQWEKESDALKIGDNSKYPQAKVNFFIGTGIMLRDNKTKAPNEISFVQHNEEEQDGRKVSTVTGYIYTYTYEDLGIKIKTSELYDPYFFEKTDKQLIARNGNIIYNNSNGSDIIGWDYIEVFFKDPEKSFDDEIREKQLPKGCTIQTGIATDHPISKHISGFQVIYISSMDGNLASDGICKMDQQLPSNYNPIAFYMDPKKPDRYYKFSYGDCAPGPCSIFGDIEFF